MENLLFVGVPILKHIRVYILYVHGQCFVLTAFPSLYNVKFGFVVCLDELPEVPHLFIIVFLFHS